VVVIATIIEVNVVVALMVVMLMVIMVEVDFHCLGAFYAGDVEVDPANGNTCNLLVSLGGDGCNMV
jgi:hypothetical protein